MLTSFAAVALSPIALRVRWFVRCLYGGYYGHDRGARGRRGDDPMIITLRGGLETIIDDESWPIAEGYKWLPSNGRRGYWYACAYRFNRRFVLHRLIANALPGQVVDHINRNTLDNRIANLRIATVSQNAANSHHRNRLSGYRGVYYAPHGLPWAVFIQREYVGKFSNKEDAA